MCPYVSSIKLPRIFSDVLTLEILLFPLVLLRNIFCGSIAVLVYGWVFSVLTVHRNAGFYSLNSQGDTTRDNKTEMEIKPVFR